MGRILVTGVKGQLGFDVAKELTKRGIDCLGTGSEDFDITEEEAVREFLISCQPETVIHCAAYTAVDKAEDAPEQCEAVNVAGSRNVAKACSEIGAKMIYLSTDYVFSGAGTGFYETDAPTGPLGVYGRTKLEGELAVRAALSRHFIVRTSWVFGVNGNNFIKTMLKLSESRDEVSVVSDQIGSPTYTADLAPLLCDMALTDRYGTYHATNEGICSFAELAEAAFREAGRNTRVNFITTEEYPTRAPRPKNSRLSKQSLDQAGFNRLPDWRDAVKRYIEEL
jgi:dTDP-4-dehydrorhamnose reductase